MGGNLLQGSSTGNNVHTSGHRKSNPPLPRSRLPLSFPLLPLPTFLGKQTQQSGGEYVTMVTYPVILTVEKVRSLAIGLTLPVTMVTACFPLFLSSSHLASSGHVVHCCFPTRSGTWETFLKLYVCPNNRELPWEKVVSFSSIASFSTGCYKVVVA